jgi:hypothetical protein
VFRSVKRKFGDAVRGKAPVARKNEVLAKLVCHNLYYVILSHLELGIETEFWHNEPKAERPLILPLKRTGLA